MLESFFFVATLSNEITRIFGATFRAKPFLQCIGNIKSEFMKRKLKFSFAKILRDFLF